jgi:hypothetical protein
MTTVTIRKSKLNSDGISGKADLLRVENTAHGKEYLIEIRNREYWFNEQRIDTQIEAIQRQQIDDIAAQLRNGKPTN